MGRDCSLRERFDLAGHPDVDSVHRDLALSGPADLGGERLKPRLVAVGQRQVAAARRQLKRQRPADTAGGAGHGGRASGELQSSGVTPEIKDLPATLARPAGFGNRPCALPRAPSA